MILYMPSIGGAETPTYSFECPACHRPSHNASGHEMRKGDIFWCHGCNSKFQVVQVLSNKFYDVIRKDGAASASP